MMGDGKGIALLLSGSPHEEDGEEYGDDESAVKVLIGEALKKMEEAKEAGDWEKAAGYFCAAVSLEKDKDY